MTLFEINDVVSLTSRVISADGNQPPVAAAAAATAAKAAAMAIEPEDAC